MSFLQWLPGNPCWNEKAQILFTNIIGGFFLIAERKGIVEWNTSVFCKRKRRENDQREVTYYLTLLISYFPLLLFSYKTRFQCLLSLYIFPVIIGPFDFNMEHRGAAIHFEVSWPLPLYGTAYEAPPLIGLINSGFNVARHISDMGSGPERRVVGETGHLF